MRSRSAAALAVLLVAPVAPVARAAELIERVLAVVDDTPVLLSETLALQRLKRVERAVALETLVDETLMQREASRLKEAAVSSQEAERAYLGLLAGLGPDGPRDEPALRRIAWRQAAILKYVDTRFRPELRVTDEELAEAHRQRPDAPALESVLPELSAELLRRALDSKIEAWVAELRAQARIRYVPDEPPS
jgi:hypothetical protein